MLKLKNTINLLRQFVFQCSNITLYEGQGQCLCAFLYDSIPMPTIPPFYFLSTVSHFPQERRVSIPPKIKQTWAKTRLERLIINSYICLGQAGQVYLHV